MSLRTSQRRPRGGKLSTIQPIKIFTKTMIVTNSHRKLCHNLEIKPIPRVQSCCKNIILWVDKIILKKVQSLLTLLSRKITLGLVSKPKLGQSIKTRIPKAQKTFPCTKGLKVMEINQLQELRPVNLIFIRLFHTMTINNMQISRWILIP